MWIDRWKWHATRVPLLALFGLLALCWLLFFHRLGDRDLWSSHEGRAAQNAQRIVDDDNWTLPRLFDNKIELQKPPLYYWMVAGLARWSEVPVDALLVRLPAACSALIIVLLLALHGSWIGRPWLGLVAAFVLATMMHFTWMARIGRIDMPLACAVTAALLAYYHKCHVVFHAGVAAAMLLKGPIGLVLPASVIVVDWLANPERPRVLPRHLIWGSALIAALVLPWYVYAALATEGGMLDRFLWYHNVERAFGGGALRAHPWWFYVPRSFADLFPWSLALPFACAWVWRQRQLDPQARFGILWFAGMIVLLSCVRFKRADYLLPAYPGAALVIAAWLVRPTIRRTALRFLPAVIAAVAVLWWVQVDHVLPAREPELEHVRFARAVREHAPAPNLVIFFRVEEHALAFHVGRPIDTILEWENLDVWASRPGPVFVLMTETDAARWRDFITSGQLERVIDRESIAEPRPDPNLVLMRTAH